jgi:hypothetical protein
MNITKYDDMIDSRDVIARIEELETEHAELMDAANEACNEEQIDRDEEARDACESAQQALADWCYENGEELITLKKLAAEAQGYSEDWAYGATLIRSSYFVEYAQQFADDIGAVNSEASWPNTCIDWEQAARELQMDYTAVEFDGITYWVR